MTFHSLDTAWSASVTYQTTKTVINSYNAKNMIITIDGLDRHSIDLILIHS